MPKKSLPSNEMLDSSDQFEKLYMSNRPLIYRFMFWRTKDKMLAEDLTSTVFEKAWRTRGNFSGGSVKAWLYRVAHTTLIDYWRKKKEIVDEEAISVLVSESPNAEEILDYEFAVAELQSALSKLPPHMQRVIRMRFIEGESARSTAARLNTTEANIRVIQYRALKKLRMYLQ